MPHKAPAPALFMGEEVVVLERPKVTTGNANSIIGFPDQMRVIAGHQ